MKRICRGRVPVGLCVCMAVLLVFPSTGTAQQQEKKSLIGAFGLACMGSVFGGGSVLAMGIVMGVSSGGGEEWESVGAVIVPLGTLSFVLGSALGIQIWDMENFSFHWALLGATVPLVIGAISGAVTAEPIADDPAERALIGAFLGSLASPLGATMGYALSRRVPPPATGVLLHLEDGKLRLGIPTPRLRPVVLLREKGTWQYQIELASVRF